MKNSSQPYTDLLREGYLGPEPFVRRALGLLEADFRDIALRALSDWSAHGVPAPEVFLAVAGLKRPSWGSWNGLLSSLRNARKSVLRSGNPPSIRAVEKAVGLTAVLDALDQSIDPGISNDLLPLVELTRRRSGKLRLGGVLEMPIAVRNRVVHDTPTDPAWWESAARALRPLLEFHAGGVPVPGCVAATPWIIEEEGEEWQFNGLTDDVAGIYVSRSGRSKISPERGGEIRRNFCHLMGKTVQEEGDLARLLTELVPEEIKGVILGDFLVGKVIGEGGHATVHQGHQMSTGRKVAVKVLRDGLDKEARDRFQQEASYLARFDHPNILKVIAYGEEHWTAPRQFSLSGEKWFEEFSRGTAVKCFIALEWIEGRTLDDMFRAPGISLAQKNEWFLKAAGALAAVQAAGLIHRDVTPRNLMVTDKDGVLKLMDFGIARPRSAIRTILTSAGARDLGTLPYMSPEQLRPGSSGAVGPASDAYSLCATFYELYTGRRHLDHDSIAPEALRDAVIRGQRDPRPGEENPEISWEIDAVLQGGLEPELADRYPGPSDIERDLQNFMADLPLLHRPPTALRRIQLAYRRNRRGANLMVTVLVLAAVIVGGMRGWAVRERAADLKRRIAVRTAEIENTRRDLARLNPEGARSAAERRLGATEVQASNQSGLPAADKDLNTIALTALLEATLAEERLVDLLRAPVVDIPPNPSEVAETAELAAQALSHRLLAVRLATQNGDFALADFTLSGRRSDPHDLDARRQEIQAAREAILKSHAQTIASSLEDVRLGLSRRDRGPESPTLDELIFDISGFRERQTAELLTTALHPYIEKAQKNSKAAAWTQAERDGIVLICKCLGNLELPELTVPALTSFMDAIWDDNLAGECGLALCCTHSANAFEPLKRASERLGVNSTAWDTIESRIARVPEPLGTEGPASADEYNTRGSARASAQRFKEAIADFGRAIELSPEDSSFWNNRGNARSRVGDLDGSIQDYRQALLLHPLDAITNLNLGDTLEQCGRVEDAIAAYSRSIELAPADPSAYLRRADLRRDRKDIAGALEDCNKALEIDPGSAMAFDTRGDVMKDIDELDKAIEDYSAAIAIDPRTSIWYVDRGQCHRRKGQLAESVKDFAAAIRINPKDSRAYRGRAWTREVQGDLDGAVQDYSLASGLNPLDSRILLDRAGTRVAFADFEGAVEDCSAAIAIDRPADAFATRADAQLGMRNHAGAIADASQAIEIDPGCAIAYAIRAAARADLKDLTGALVDCDRAIAIDPKSARVYCERAHLWLLAGKYDAALVDFAEAIRLGPYADSAYWNRGLAEQAHGDSTMANADFNAAAHMDAWSAERYLERSARRKRWGDSDNAIADLTKAIYINPKYADAYNNRGNVRRETKDLAGAIEDYTKAIEIEPKYAAALNNRGTARRETKDLTGAIEDYTKAVEINPKYPDAYYNRGLVRREAKDLSGAIEDYTKAIEINPKYALAFCNRGNARRESNDLAGAIEDYTKAIEIDSNYAAAFNNRGLVRSETKDFAGAIEDYTNAIEINPKFIQAFNNRGNARRTAGDFSDAIDDFTAAVALDPNFAPAYQGRGILLFVNGELGGAIADLSKAIAKAPTPRAGAYASFFLFLARLKTGEEQTARDSLRACLDRIPVADRGDWVSSVGGFLVGEIQEASLLASAEQGSGRERLGHQCEAWFYAGELRLLRGDASTARIYFERCLATKMSTFGESVAASAELRRLETPK